MAGVESVELFRFITCGSVDDGKSTLLGRLLYETGQLAEDQLATLVRDSQRHGTQGSEIDYALLLDGLDAEREQGITIDVSYRHLVTPRRHFIVADCPGHEQYTRNMATGASTADLAVVLVDARKGVLTQTRRHSYIVSLVGIGQVILAVNKMDLVDYAESAFEAIVAEYRQLAAALGIAEVQAIPVSALHGSNLIGHDPRMPWYRGPSLLACLESAPVRPESPGCGFRMPVQWVNRPDAEFRGYAGTVAAGSVAPGDDIVVLPAGVRARVAQVLDVDAELRPRACDRAEPGQAITLTFDREIDASRGDVIAQASDAPGVADQFAAHLLWLDGAPLLPGRRYWLKLGTRTVGAQVTEIKHRVDINNQEHLAAKRLEANEVGYCNLSLDAPIVFEPYAINRRLGGFVLIDRLTHATAGAGTLDFALRRAGNIHWQALAIDKAARARSKGQSPRCLWFTGLSGAGKSTIADRVEKRLHALGHHTYLLDGDNVRHGLNKDLGFTDEDRVENIRRVAEVARLMVDAGLIVLVSFISPFRSERRMARELFAPGEFIEVFVDTPLAVAEQRDVKGLYAKARAGRIPNFTGIDSPYEPPEAPELWLDTQAQGPDELAEAVVARVLAPD